MATTDRQRLVIVSGTFPDMTCGISPYVRRIAEMTARRGEYDVCVLTSSDPAVNEGIAEGYRVYPRIKTWGPHVAGSICREILKLEPDVVHIQNPTAQYTGWRSLTMSAVAKRLKTSNPAIRIVVMQHDIAVGRPILRRRYSPLFRSSDAIVVSNSRDEKAICQLGIPANKLYRAPLSTYVDFQHAVQEDKAQSRTQFGIPEDHFCVAYFGYMLPGRHIDVLIGALCQLRQRGRKVFGLMIGGAHPESPGYYDQCRAFAEELQMQSHIRWTGYADESQIARGLAAADAFVSLPDRGADLRNTSILTGILAKLPIVTTRNTRYGVDEELESLGCVCVNEIESETVAKAIEQVMADRPSMETLAKNAAAFDPEVIWPRHIEINHRAYRGDR